MDGVTTVGVVAWVRSASEGGCDVEGVSISASEGTATVEACDSSGSSVGVWIPSVVCSVSTKDSSGAACSREGNARPSSCAGTATLRLLLRLAARGGNSASGTDSHGKGGQKGLNVVGCGAGGGGAGWAGFDSTTGGGVMVVLVSGVEADTWVCECTEGVEGGC